MPSSSITGAYPNVVIQTGLNDDFGGTVTQINGNLTINQGAGKIFYVNKTNGAANTTLTVNKSVFVIILIVPVTLLPSLVPPPPPAPFTPFRTSSTVVAPTDKLL
jgi:hypothetical protein